MKTYRVKEMFYTLQGEGVHAGRPAVFLRFTGCNLWSGDASTREADAARTGAKCPLWCDTDFVGGDRLTAEQVVARAAELGAGVAVPVIATGGEPLLQLDAALLDAFEAKGINVHLETNGTVRPYPGVVERLAWVCMSPKVAPNALTLLRCNELKVVFPSYPPLEYEAVVSADHLFVQPEDGPKARENTARAVEFVMAYPTWRLSLQTHKILGVP